MSVKLTGQGKIYHIKNFGKVIAFSIGSSRKVKGEFVTDFFNAKILGQDNVEYFMGRNFAEKDKVTFTGSLVTNSWEKEGKKVNSVEIIINELELAQKDADAPVKANPAFTTSDIPF